MNSYTRVYIHMYTYIYVYTYVYIYMYIYIRMYTRIYIYMHVLQEHVYMYICIYISIHIYIIVLSPSSFPVPSSLRLFARAPGRLSKIRRIWAKEPYFNGALFKNRHVSCSLSATSQELQEYYTHTQTHHVHSHTYTHHKTITHKKITTKAQFLQGFFEIENYECYLKQNGSFWE